jgi:hypothetical protein
MDWGFANIGYNKMAGAGVLSTRLINFSLLIMNTLTTKFLKSLYLPEQGCNFAQH